MASFSLVKDQILQDPIVKQKKKKKKKKPETFFALRTYKKFYTKG